MLFAIISHKLFEVVANLVTGFPFGDKNNTDCIGISNYTDILSLVHVLEKSFTDCKFISPSDQHITRYYNISYYNITYMIFIYCISVTLEYLSLMWSSIFSMIKDRVTRILSN